MSSHPTLHHSPTSPSPTADSIIEAAELLQHAGWDEQELASVGWDKQKVDEIIQRMRERLAETEDD